MNTKTNDQENTTKVQVIVTIIKYFDEDQETVEQIKVLSKVTIGQAKKIIKELGGRKVLIGRIKMKEEFYVNTETLYSLKENINNTIK